MSFKDYWKRASYPHWLCSSWGDRDAIKNACHRAYAAGVKHERSRTLGERDEATDSERDAACAAKCREKAAAKADEWRECAEDFAETFAGSRPAQWARDEAYAKFEALKKAGVEAALAKFERLKEGGK
jgi:hypothetical protein